MTLGTRVILSLVFVTMGVCICLYPKNTSAYIEARYQILRQDLQKCDDCKWLAELTKEKLIQTTPEWHFYIVGALSIIAAFSIGLHFNPLIYFFIFAIFTASCILHYPHFKGPVEIIVGEKTSSIAIQQWRTFIFTMAVCAVLIMITGSPKRMKRGGRQQKPAPTAVERNLTRGRKPKPKK
jgi:hypothetical protein